MSCCPTQPVHGTDAVTSVHVSCTIIRCSSHVSLDVMCFIPRAFFTFLTAATGSRSFGAASSSLPVSKVLAAHAKPFQGSLYFSFLSCETNGIFQETLDQEGLWPSLLPVNSVTHSSDTLSTSSAEHPPNVLRWRKSRTLREEAAITSPHF